MTRTYRKAGAGPFSYEGKGNPQGKNQPNKQQQSKIPGEKLPGYGPQPEHVWGEVEASPRPSFFKHSGAPVGHRDYRDHSIVYIGALVAAIAGGYWGYMHLMPGGDPGRIGNATEKTSHAAAPSPIAEPASPSAKSAP